jgi:hypothetical protein
VFQKPKVLGKVNTPPHSIRLTDESSINTRPFRHSQAEHAEIRNQTTNILQKGVIKHSTSPWAAPVVLAKKKDGTWRFCIDYRGLNSTTIRDAYPLPRIDDALDALFGAKYFTTLDAWTGYWQVKMNPPDAAKTGFVTRDGHYEFVVMPFGLVNTPATFQCAMNLTLHGLTWHTCLVYLDDIIVFSDTFDEHFKRLDEVLSRLEAANIYLKLPKCTFCADTVEYLGHVVSDKGVSPNPKKVEWLKNMAVPTDVSTLRSFLGLANYYHRFIHNFTKTISPLTRLLKKNQEFTWSDKC